jgi:hypothetical protein
MQTYLEEFKIAVNDEDSEIKIETVIKSTSLSKDLSFTCMTTRWSGQRQSHLIYIGDSEGACHIYDSKRGEFLKVY